MNQFLPGKTPMIFAPGRISTEDFEFTITFSPQMDELYFTRRKTREKNKIYVMKYENNKWSEPIIAPFSNSIMDFEPFITPDGEKLYFGSKRPINKKIPDRSKIWYFTKSDSGWTDLKLIEPPFDSIFVMYVSVANNKNLYFTGKEDGNQYIFVSKYKDLKYQQPEKLSAAINSEGWIAHPYISPNEDYLIFDAKDRSDNFGSTDLYISFKDRSGNWVKAINMGKQINTKFGEIGASVSPDGKFLFFCRHSDLNNGDIYWVNSSVINKLRGKQQ